MRVILEPVLESEGECSWEVCAPAKAEAWRATVIDDAGDVRAWAYKTRANAVAAACDLMEGRMQPQNLTGFASTGTRCAYLP